MAASAPAIVVVWAAYRLVEECADKGITGTGRIDDLDLMSFGGDMIVAPIQGGAIFSLRVDDTLAAMRKQKRKRFFDVVLTGDEFQFFVGELQNVGIGQKLVYGLLQSLCIVPEGEAQVRVKADEHAFFQRQLQQCAVCLLHR